jgi:hypothetical protein
MEEWKQDIKQVLKDIVAEGGPGNQGLDEYLGRKVELIMAYMPAEEIVKRTKKKDAESAEK